MTRRTAPKSFAQTRAYVMHCRMINRSCSISFQLNSTSLSSATSLLQNFNALISNKSYSIFPSSNIAPLPPYLHHISCPSYPCRLRPNNPRNEAAHLVKEVSIECWSVDTGVAVNLIRLLPNLQTLNIWIGPNNFTPEHLEEFFLKPYLGLKHLFLMFRP